MKHPDSTTEKPWQRLLAVTTCRDTESTLPSPSSPSPWTDYLELSIPQYGKQLLPLLVLLGFSTTLEVVDVAEVMISIASLLRNITPSYHDPRSEATLSNILTWLKEEYRVTDNPGIPSDACYQAIFILCGLLSMVYEPSTESKEGKVCINAPKWLVAQGLIQPEVPLKTIVHKPLGFFLRSYGQLLPEPRHDVPAKTRAFKMDRASEQVYAPSLSAYSLRYIGKISFEWTSILSNHLTFLPLEERTLLVFRYPSFCAMSLWPEDRSVSDHSVSDHSVSDHSVFDTILHEYYPGPDPKSSRSTALHQEIILSYRLLFGQDPKSRQIFKEISANQKLNDPLLSLLCTKGAGKKIYSLPSYYWPAACRHHVEKEGRLREQSTYSLNADFPLLADRLEALQAYMKNQKASRKRDMYRDRRNAGEWLASWPVLIFAAIAIILSFLQLVVATVQLGFSIAQSI